MVAVRHFWDPWKDLAVWAPTEKTSYAAGVVLLSANRGSVPEVLLILQNQDDPERFAQRDDKKGAYRREKLWKCPIGRFNPGRDVSRGLDAHLWHTVTEEFKEETGVGIDAECLMRAPLFEYRKDSLRPGSDFHVDRISFLITPDRPEPNPEVYQNQKELIYVKYFPLSAMPNGSGEHDDNAAMAYSHVRRIIEFLEAPQAANLKWQAGIPDDIGMTIRAHFEGCGYRFLVAA